MTTEKDVRLDELRKECLQYENAFKLEKDPSTKLEHLQVYIFELESGKFGSEAHVNYFLGFFLPKAIGALLRRKYPPTSFQ